MKKHKYSYFANYILWVPTKSFQRGLLQNIDLEEVRKLFLSDKLIQEAIFLASKNLHDESINMLDNNELMEEKLLKSLLKYILRIHTRCTPFGLFAGNTQLGEVTKEKSCICLNEQRKFKRHVRIDSGLLYNISNYLASVDDVKDRLKLFSNNSLYKIGDNFRYIETIVKNNQLNFIINSIENDEYLKKIIQFSKEGVYLQDICKLLKNDGFEEDDVRTYVHELLNNHVLFPEIELSTIETQPLSRLISLLKEKVPVTQNNLIKSLEEIAYFINDYANNEKNSHIACYMKLINSNSLIKQNTTSNLIQLDLQMMSIQNHISEKIANSLLEGVDVLNKLSIYQSNKNLELFKSRFIERYEYNEVPLLKVLDTELGLGFPVSNAKLQSPLIDDIRFVKNGSESYEIRWNRINTFLNQKIGEFFLSTDKNEIELSDSELSEFESSDNYLPDTLSALVEIYMTDEGEKIYFPGLSSPSANYFGRFASFDLGIKDYIKEKLYSKESEYIDNETLFAEISHFPDNSRTGNILLRPSFTEYEIPLIATSLLSFEKQIKLDDLLVSIRNNEIVLRSLRLNKRVIPRLSTAHNYNRYENLSIYKFLCSIYNQNKKERFGIDWSVLASLPFLPRIVYKNLILSKATWSLNSKSLNLFYTASDTDLLRMISTWRIKYRIPSSVVLRDFDNKLYINFDNITLIKLFLHIVKNRGQFTLEEFIFSNENGFVFDEKGDMFTNEFIFSFYKNKA
jgi:hypothetical protein